MNLRNRILAFLFPPRDWQVSSSGTYPMVWFVNGRSLIGRRYAYGPFSNEDDADDLCWRLNRGPD